MKLALRTSIQEDITLKEDFGTMITMQDDDFGDVLEFIWIHS